MRARIRRTRVALAAACLTIAPLLAAAAEEGGAHEGGSPWKGLAFKTVNFLILLAILFKALKKPVTQGLSDRAEGVRRELQEAREAKDAAETKYREYKERVSRLEDEIKQLREDFRAEGERQKERILREAQEAAAAVSRQAEAAGANEVKRAKDELRLELADLSVRLAEEILTKTYTAEDQKKAVAQTIQNVERIH
ncbi:MAG: ATP synthase F0 subunit B [Deltaproteobacteria bacterium]|nr:ATP synthase F0 subunit B [Deltaproteobacteria bacterium]